MAAAVLLQIGATVIALVLIALLYDLVRSFGRPKDAAAGEAELTALRTSYSAAEVDIIRGLLESNGIPAIISSDDASGWRPDGMWRPRRVLVRRGDLERAEELIAEVTADQ